MMTGLFLPKESPALSGADKNQGNILFVFPHQDDEMLIFHRIRHFLGQKRQIFMVWVTDGAAHSPEVRKSLIIKLTLPLLAVESDEKIRKVRENESISLMHMLEMPRNNLKFLGFPSGQAKDCFPEIVSTLEDVFREINPQEIYTVSYDNGEFEHDICNAAVNFASRVVPQAQVYEYPVVNVYKGMLRVHWLIPFRNSTILRTPFSMPEENERLRLFRSVYRSQWFAAWMESIVRLLPSDYKRLGEPYRIMPEHNYSAQITDARLNYRPRSLSFKDFRKAVAGYLK
jgi:LmbE family N-acetylglucosaminyl deacetylase